MPFIATNEITLAIQPGQTWKYVKPNPANGKVGDEYGVTGTPLMKIGESKEWERGVLYVRLVDGAVADDDEPNLFCRDEVMFRKNFEFVPK